MFTMKYGSIIVMEQMTYAEALPLYGLRQNVYTDPQKPMKVEPGIYPLNGADENAVVVTTVDFALTYFVVSGELERSGVPLNLVINDAGGLSVLTSWAAGKFSGNSISAYIKENVEPKVKSRKLIIPGKVAVLKGDLEAKLPGWAYGHFHRIAKRCNLTHIDLYAFCDSHIHDSSLNRAFTSQLCYFYGLSHRNFV